MTAPSESVVVDVGGEEGGVRSLQHHHHSNSTWKAQASVAIILEQEKIDLYVGPRPSRPLLTDLRIGDKLGGGGALH